MSHHDHDPGDLVRALRAQAAQVEDQPLALDDVKGRARSIRRRRVAASGIAAAAVLAVAVPVGLGLQGGLDDRDSSGPATGLTPQVSESPRPRETVRVELSRDVPTSEEPLAIDYVLGNRLVEAGGPGPGSPVSGSPVTVDAAYDDAVQLGEGWVAARNDDDGDRAVDILDADGTVTGSYPATSQLAVSHDGSIVVFAGADGDLLTVSAGEQPRPVGEPGLSLGDPWPAGVVGSGSCDPEGPGGGCTVFANDTSSEEPGALAVTSRGTLDRIGDLLTVQGVSPDRQLTGVISATDEGSCSALLGSDGTRAWRTCDHTLGRFSPDGRLVLGHPSYQDGLGDGTIAILDVQTGEVLVEASTGPDTPTVVFDSAWESDRAVVMLVWEQGEWDVLRLTADGELTNITAGTLPETQSEIDPPIWLSAQP